MQLNTGRPFKIVTYQKILVAGRAVLHIGVNDFRLVVFRVVQNVVVSVLLRIIFINRLMNVVFVAKRTKVSYISRLVRILVIKDLPGEPKNEVEKAPIMMQTKEERFYASCTCRGSRKYHQDQREWYYLQQTRHGQYG